MLDRKVFLQRQGWLGSEHGVTDCRGRDRVAPLRPSLRLLMTLGRGLGWLEARSFDKGTNEDI